MIFDLEDIRAYVLEKNLVDASVPIEIERLQGGVSCAVWKIVNGDIRLVLKHALAKLNVAVDWFSDVKRIEQEEAAMRFLEPLMPTGSIPSIVDSDRSKHVYIMTCAPEDAMNWKTLLMQGNYEEQVMRNAGTLLKSMHENSRKSTELQREPFYNLSYFYELRIEPFYRFLNSKYPQLSDKINLLVKQLTEENKCLVHGDFTTKNMLIDRNRDIILLDFEVAHWGNPIFDVALFTTHLLLKGWAFDREEQTINAVNSFLDAYGEVKGDLLSHIAMLLLARMDGKSPVEYISDENKKQRIREIAFRWLKDEQYVTPDVNDATKHAVQLRISQVMKGES